MADLQTSYVRACHDFPGAEQGDLPFASGDVLYVDNQIDRNWCHGQSMTTSQSGIFPSTFVTKLNLPRLLQTSSQKLFIARDRFIGQEQGDLSFLEGDIVVGLRAIDENWWEGEAGGRRGIFPLTFVIELRPPASSSSSAALFTNGQNSQLSSVSKASPLSISISAGRELSAKVKHDLRPVDPQELELKAGDVVIIEEFVDKFTCRGRTLDGRRGLFGKGFVEIIDQKSNGAGAVSASSRNSIPSGGASIPELRNVDFSTGLPAPISGISHQVSPLRHRALEKPKVSSKPIGFTSPSASSSLSPRTVKQETVAPYGRTKYKFEAEYPGELAFTAGVIVQLIRHVDDEWTEGILDGRRGIFPTSYVDIVVDCPRLQWNSPRSTSVAQGQDSGSFRDAPQRQGEFDLLASINAQLAADSGYGSSAVELSRLEGSKDAATRKVKYDFMGTEDGDLTAFKGDPISVIKEINEEWLEAKHLITGQIGVIPITYVQSDQVKIEWRQDKSSSVYNEYVTPSNAATDLLNAPIAQSVIRPEHEPMLTVRQEKPRWSPAPGLTSQTCSVLSIVESWAPTPSTPALSSNLVKTNLQPTMPQARRQQLAQTAEPKLSTPPPRPAVPAALKMRQETASQHLEMQRQQAKEQKKKEMRAQRSKIIQEIMSTEREYGKDLGFFQEIVYSKRNMLDADDLLGGAVWRNIIDLSARLLALLEEESGKDFVYQEIGSAFLALVDDFKRIYGAFCQSHEESQALLDRYETEPEKQIVLKDMLTKVQQRTMCIDLSTMLSRPVQRVLKYPLFLGELLKCTEDNQSDKVQLMKALKVMTEVAQTLNESKRRRDLVTKYRKDGDVTFSERLSRLTLHSMRKKSTRLSMRLSTSIGWTQVAKDGQFEDVERQFRAVDRSCKNLLRDVQAYCEQIVVLYNHQMSIADALHYGIYNSGGCGGTSPRNTNRSSVPSTSSSRQASIDGERSSSSSLPASAQLSSRYLESWSKILLSESILQRFFDAVNVKFRQPLAHIQHSCKGPEKLISKRGDKFLDYESVMVKLEKLKLDGVQAADSAKSATLEEDMRKAKAEYEAMNTQLLTELPQFNRLASEIITMAVRAFVAAQRTFVYEFGRCFEQTIGIGDVSVIDGSVLENFQRKHRQAAESIGRLCFVGDASSFGGVKQTGTLVKRQISGGSIVSRPSMVQHKPRPTITFPLKLQTENDRCVLRSQYGARQLFIVAGGYDARADLELTLKDGDLVGVIVDKDPMGSGERWFVDNGVSKGFVPRDVLRPSAVNVTDKPKLLNTNLELIDLSEAIEKRKRDPVANMVKLFEDEASAEKSAGSAPAVTPKQQPKASVVNVARRGSPVIFLPSDQQPASADEPVAHAPARRPLRRRTTVVRDTSVPPAPASAHPRPTSVVETVGRKTSETATSATVEKKMTSRRPAPAPPKDIEPPASVQEVVQLHPVRPAPRPPPQQSVVEARISEGVGVQGREKEERSSNSEESDEIEFYVALYPFTANSENELSMADGQIVAVHDKKDLESNPDWWLVEDEDGALGYVPGNYLTPHGPKGD